MGYQNEICTIREPFKVFTNAFQNHFESSEAVKITLTFTMGKWFDHSCFEYTMYNVQSCTPNWSN